MTISREIGWSPEANLMYSISNKIDRITQIMCCAGVTTTTTSTTIPITTTTTTRIPCDYEGVMTVGTNDVVYGYLQIFGSINPLDENINNIFWNSSNNDLGISLLMCYDEITLYIDDVIYIIPFVGEDGVFVYTLAEVLSNPFPAVGETCNISLCYGNPCTTTTTTTLI
jgi:hypothetical protein